jgi:hypothetical protein
VALTDTSFAGRLSVVDGPVRPSSVRWSAGAHGESRSHRGYLAGRFGTEASWIYCQAFTRGEW